MITTSCKILDLANIAGWLVLATTAFISACSTETPQSQTDNLPFHAAAVTAAKDPLTWAPIIVAAAFTVGDADKNAAHSLYTHTPVYGSNDQAERSSDQLNTILKTAAITSSLLVPQESPDNNIISDIFALSTVSSATAFIKQTTQRKRPDGSDHESFPSGHTSQAFSAARIFSDNLEYYNFSDVQRQNLTLGAYAIATGTGWARMEAGKHHPTDVLVGAAFGNFLTVFLNHLLKKHENVRTGVDIDPSDNSAIFNISIAF